MSDTIATAADQPVLSRRDTAPSPGRRSIGRRDSNPPYGFGLRIHLDEVLERGAKFPTLFAGHTPSGGRYLVRYAPRPDTWLCAAITERALSCVREGRSELRAAFAHTATGAVEVITVASDGRYTESLRLCSELADEELPPSGTCLHLCA